MKNIKTILKDKHEELFAKKNIVATGIGYKIKKGRKTSTLAIICSVEKKVSLSELKTSDKIPSKFHGKPTDVVETGKIVALEETNGNDRTARWRPAPGGVSIGHPLITAGTLGCLVKKEGEVFILSNNHVLANSNEANIGDPIIQPGTHDGGMSPDDNIAILSNFIPISFLTNGDSSCPIVGFIVKILNAFAKILGRNSRLKGVAPRELNTVDAAIAKPLFVSHVKEEILEVGIPSGVVKGTLGLPIKKSGRTTGLTTGEILQTNVIVNVGYGGSKIATFVDQLMAGAMSAGGDSGSVVLDNDNHLVGLLFAGSDTTTIINRIENVFSGLGVNI